MANSISKIFSVMQTSFDNFDESVRAYLTKALGAIGQEYSPNQIFGTIFSGIKGALQNIMVYIEDALTEQNIYTATRKRSFYSLAKQSGYDPYSGSASTGTLNVTPVRNALAGISCSKVYIKDGTTVINKSNGLTYTLMLPCDEYVIDLSRALMTHQMKVVQGDVYSMWYTAIGDHFETVTVSASGLYDAEYTEVYVNSIQATIVPCIYDLTSSDLGCVVKPSFDGSFDVTFGNGTHGKVLAEGDMVQIKYLIHAGESGNVSRTDVSDFVWSGNVYDASGAVVSNIDEYVGITVDTSITGGTDADSIALVREMIGFNSRSLVIGTEDNIKMFLKRYSFVGPVRIISNPNSLCVSISALNNNFENITEPVEYLNLSSDDMFLTESQKSLLTDALNNSTKTFVGMTFEFVDPVVSSFAISAYVTVSSGYVKDTVEECIKDAIASYFMSLPCNTTFVAKSDIIKAVVEASDDITSFDFDFVSEDNEIAYRDGYYTTYSLVDINGDATVIETKNTYSNTSVVRLDDVGNISLESDFQIPVLRSGIKYYPNKDVWDKTTTVTLEAINVHFL